jgi:serine/threonine-protein kinase RsbT
METETLTEIHMAVDIVTARQRGRSLALEIGFNGADVTLIAAAISEVARNILDHAQHGEIIMSSVTSPLNGGRQGIQIIARDEGPGIRDVAQAMQYGYSTRKGLGVGLPGAKWLMDEFDIASEVGRGTTITMKKWRRR